MAISYAERYYCGYLHNHYVKVCVGFSCFKVFLLEEEAFITELFNKSSSPSLRRDHASFKESTASVLTTEATRSIFYKAILKKY